MTSSSTLDKLIGRQERMMTSFFVVVEGGGRACNFHSGCSDSRISCVYYK